MSAHVVRAMYDAVAAADVNAFTALLDPDVRWTVPGNHALAGTTFGVPDLLVHLAEVAQRTEGHMGIDVIEVVTGGVFTLAVVDVEVSGGGRTTHDRERPI